MDRPAHAEHLRKGLVADLDRPVTRNARATGARWKASSSVCCSSVEIRVADSAASAAVPGKFLLGWVSFITQQQWRSSRQCQAQHQPRQQRTQCQVPPVTRAAECWRSAAQTDAVGEHQHTAHVCWGVARRQGGGWGESPAANDAPQQQPAKNRLARASSNILAVTRSSWAAGDNCTAANRACTQARVYHGRQLHAHR